MLRKLKTFQPDLEFQQITIDGIEFSYKVIQEKRKTISFSITLDRKLIVKTPIRFPKKEIKVNYKATNKSGRSEKEIC